MLPRRTHVCPAVSIGLCAKCLCKYKQRPHCSAGSTSSSMAALALRSLGQMSLLYASRMKVSASSKWILSRSWPLPCAAHAEAADAA